MNSLKTATLAVAFAALASPAFADEWTTVKNEPDPFEPSKSAYIALTLDIHAGLAGLVIRCLQGGVSLVVTNVPSNAAKGDPAPLKIVTDGQPPRDEHGAIVLLSTAQATAVQFGNEATVAYLKGARQVSVRYIIGGVTMTETFEGGKPMDDVIDTAVKACGKSHQTKEEAQANDALVAANQTADWYYKDGNEDGAECHAISGTPKQFADADVGKGATRP
jgi:hypothetical protein